MKRTFAGPTAALLLLVAVAVPATADPVPEIVNEPGEREAASGADHPTPPTIAGTVTETMSAEHYTYLEVATDSGKLWAVGPRTQVEVGETVSLSGGFRMVNFHSSTLDRTFDEITMVASIEVAGREETGSGARAVHGGPARSGERPQAQGGPAGAAEVERVEEGHTIAEIVDGRSRLAGKQVTVRGRIAKFSSRILGRNWLRLLDATTGPESVPYLVVTTTDTAAVGDTVLVRGTVVVDQDLGSGYVFEVLVEKARIVVEVGP